MFKNIKTGVKLAVGFGLVVSILIALGVVGYAMFSGIDRNVTRQCAHYLTAVRHSADMECEALETMLQAKNYALYKSDESQRDLEKHLTELVANSGPRGRYCGKIPRCRTSPPSEGSSRRGDPIWQALRRLRGRHESQPELRGRDGRQGPNFLR